MGLFDKAKDFSDRVSNSITDFSSDEVIANAIIKAVEKQEKVNELLREKNSNYRVSDIELQMGIPPTVSFAVRRMNEGAGDLAPDIENTGAPTANLNHHQSSTD